MTGRIVWTDLRCACGSAEIVSVEPGQAPLMFRRMAVTRNVAVKAWCLPCLVRRGLLAEADVA